MDWQARYELGDIPWDRGEAAPSLCQLLAESECFTSEKCVLVPGCGFGHDVLKIAEGGCSVTGVDIAPLAVEIAKVRSSGLDNVRIYLGDIFALPEEMLGTFDLVWEHTCFCALDPKLRERYVESMWAALKPGAFLIGVFYVPADFDADGPPFASTRDAIIDVFAPRFSLEWEADPKACYSGREGEERIMSFCRLGE